MHKCYLSAALFLAMCATALAQVDPAKLSGMVLDDTAAVYEGAWTKSTSTRPFLGAGYQHDGNTEQGTKTATFTTRVLENGIYHVLLSYTAGSNRATNVSVMIHSASEEKTVKVNQKQTPALGTFIDLGDFEFQTQKDAVVVISNAGANGHVIVDGLQILTPDEFALVQKQAPKAAAKPKPPAVEPAPKFVRVPAKDAATITSDELDGLLREDIGGVEAAPISDELFLRRATLDIVGRQPTIEELQTFTADTSAHKRANAIDRLLESEDYGRNWGNYWSDVIGSRQQEPELTFHNYDPFKSWLAEQFNADAGWDEMVYHMLTARGKVGEHPEGTFLAFHQANEKKLAGETSRVFLSVQIACAECHDHPFMDMPTETFHGMAAFFVRTGAKIPHNDSNKIELVSKDKGEHKIPGKKGEMKPIALNGIDGGAEYELGLPDMQRRATLARWIVNAENPFFARAYVNRVFARLMGRGFYEPVDEQGEMAADPMLPKLHDRLAEHFIATGYDHKDFIRLLANTSTYQQSVGLVTEDAHPLATARMKKLRGDEIFDSLALAINLPNIQPPQAKATGAIRFPVPPKSTRDLVNEAFGYDPSLQDDLLVRTMKQAMFMMNNEQLQKQIDPQPDSETFLAKLLADEADDTQLATRLYHAVLARSPSEKELGIVLAHCKQLNDRPAAFEDLLWSLINSAEFTTRR